MYTQVSTYVYAMSPACLPSHEKARTLDVPGTRVFLCCNVTSLIPERRWKPRDDLQVLLLRSIGMESCTKFTLCRWSSLRRFSIVSGGDNRKVGRSSRSGDGLKSCRCEGTGYWGLSRLAASATDASKRTAFYPSLRVGPLAPFLGCTLRACSRCRTTQAGPCRAAGKSCSGHPAYCPLTGLWGEGQSKISAATGGKMLKGQRSTFISRT